MGYDSSNCIISNNEASEMSNKNVLSYISNFSKVFILYYYYI